MKSDKDLIIKLIEYGLKKPSGFNAETILKNKDLKLGQIEEQTAQKYLENAHRNRRIIHGAGYPNLETIFLLINGNPPGGWDDEKCVYIINLDSKFKYINYLELKEARATSRKAHKLSTFAIIISMLSILIAALIAFFITQNVRLDNTQYQTIESQIQELINKK